MNQFSEVFGSNFLKYLIIFFIFKNPNLKRENVYHEAVKRLNLYGFNLSNNGAVYLESPPSPSSDDDITIIDLE